MLLERDEQLSLLRGAMAEVARTRRGQIALVSGEAGAGKTALLREFCGSADGAARVLWAACDPLFTPRPLGPLLDLAAQTGGDLASQIREDARPYDVRARAALQR